MGKTAKEHRESVMTTDEMVMIATLPSVADELAKKLPGVVMGQITRKEAWQAIEKVMESLHYAQKVLIGGVEYAKGGEFLGYDE